MTVKELMSVYAGRGCCELEIEDKFNFYQDFGIGEEVPTGIENLTVEIFNVLARRNKPILVTIIVKERIL